MNSVTARSTESGRHRPHASVPRTFRLAVLFTGPELEAIRAAAKKAGMKPGAYIAQAGTDAAAAGGLSAARAADVVAGMSDAVTAANRVGRNFNQAVAKLHALGEHSPDLEASAAAVARAVTRMERAVLSAARRLK